MSQPPQKKRKKSSSSSRRKSAPPSVVTLDVTPSDPSVDPILCAFPGGLPAALQSATSSPEDAQLPRFVVKEQRKQHALSWGSRRKLVVGKDHACLYAAASRSGPINASKTNLKSKSPHRNGMDNSVSAASSDSALDRPLQTVVAIYDKKRGRVTLQPTADHGFVYTMSQSVPSYAQRQKRSASNNDNNDDDDDDENALATAAARRQALFADFGSAKKQRVIKSQEANRVNVESVVGAGHVSELLASMSSSNQQAVQGSNNGATGDQAAADAATDAWRQSFLPPYQAMADDPALIYSGASIAGPAVWQRLVPRVQAALRSDDPLVTLLQGDRYHRSPDEDHWYPSVVRILKLLISGKPAANSSSKRKSSSSSTIKTRHLTTQVACALLLQDFLHLYVQLNRRRFIPAMSMDRPRFFGVDRLVAARWMERFTTPTTDRDGTTPGAVMSKAQTDACQVHLLLLSLLAEDRYQSHDLQPLVDDMQLDLKDASLLLRLAGCTVKPTARGSPSTTTMAVLKVPVIFPPLPRKRGRNR